MYLTVVYFFFLIALRLARQRFDGTKLHPGDILGKSKVTNDEKRLTNVGFSRTNANNPILNYLIIRLIIPTKTTNSTTK